MENKPDCSLGLSIDLSISVQPSKSSKDFSATHNDASDPLQLDLLPRPLPQKKNNGLLWQSLFSKSRPETSDSNEAANCKGLDMNAIPCLTEAEEAGGFQLMEPTSKKREREVEESEQNVLARAASDEEEGGTRKKLRLSKEQSALLEESFREHSTLNPKQKNALAKQLSLRPRQVEVWFQNRRARTKLKQTEVDCELLKKYCEGLSEENRRLQKELQELRALKISPPCVITHDFYMPLPATTLTMCPSCERLASMENNNSNSNRNTSIIKPTASFHNTNTRFSQPV